MLYPLSYGGFDRRWPNSVGISFTTRRMPPTSSQPRCSFSIASILDAARFCRRRVFAGERDFPHVVAPLPLVAYHRPFSARWRRRIVWFHWAADTEIALARQSR